MERLLISFIVFIMVLRGIYSFVWIDDGTAHYAHDCDFKGNDLKNEKTTAEKCGPVCEANKDCTHFCWASKEGGTCYLKGGRVGEGDAVAKDNENAVCGYLRTRAGDTNADVDVSFMLVICGIRNAETVPQMSEDDRRNTLIVEVNKKIGIPIPEVQGKKNSELITLMQNCTTENNAKGLTVGTSYSVICPNNGVVTGISGHYDFVLDGISFTCTSSTGETKFGPYGGPEPNKSKPYAFKCPANHYISSFYGRSGQLLDQLGVRCRNATDMSSKGTTPSDGLFGGSGGTDFDDISHSFGKRPVAIQIYIYTFPDNGKRVVSSIRVAYGDLKINLCSNCKAGGATKPPPPPPVVTEKPKPTGLNEDKCGNRPPSFRIVNGREASPNSWPWMVSIVEIKETETKHICGGSLISTTAVLTAAHCFAFKTKGSKYKVRLGSHKLSERVENEVEREVSDVILHEKYVNVPSSLFDISIVKLATPVEYTDFVSPLCLGQPDQLSINGTCYVTGWGRTRENGPLSDTLLELELPILPNDQCQKILTNKFNAETQICGAYENGGKDACQGDSGGPLLCEDKSVDKWRLQGIVSWGKGCARKGNPGVYTRVSYYKDWIIEHI